MHVVNHPHSKHHSPHTHMTTPSSHTPLHNLHINILMSTTLIELQQVHHRHHTHHHLCQHRSRVRNEPLHLHHHHLRTWMMVMRIITLIMAQQVRLNTCTRTHATHSVLTRLTCVCLKLIYALCVGNSKVRQPAFSPSSTSQRSYDDRPLTKHTNDAYSDERPLSSSSSSNVRKHTNDAYSDDRPLSSSSSSSSSSSARLYHDDDRPLSSSKTASTKDKRHESRPSSSSSSSRKFADNDSNVRSSSSSSSSSHKFTHSPSSSYRSPPHSSYSTIDDDDDDDDIDRQIAIEQARRKQLLFDVAHDTDEYSSNKKHSTHTNATSTSSPSSSRPGSMREIALANAAALEQSKRKPHPHSTHTSTPSTSASAQHQYDDDDDDDRHLARTLQSSRISSSPVSSKHAPFMSSRQRDGDAPYSSTDGMVRSDTESQLLQYEADVMKLNLNKDALTNEYNKLGAGQYAGKTRAQRDRIAELELHLKQIGRELTVKNGIIRKLQNQMR